MLQSTVFFFFNVFKFNVNKILPFFFASKWTAFSGQFPNYPSESFSLEDCIHTFNFFIVQK